MERFGEKLKVLRTRHYLSLRQLATELGLATHSHLDRIERGESSPSPELILKIADYFGVSLEALMRDELDIN